MIRVSTIIATYNSAATLRKAVDSALHQDLDDHEIIVVNDGSTDDTEPILKEYNRKITAINQPNLGRARARNTALDHAKGAFVAFLDADDQWLPNKLNMQVAALVSRPDCVLAYSDAAGVDSEGRLLASSIQPPRYAHAPTWEELLECGVWPSVLSSWVVRSSTIKRCRGFDESFGRRWGGEDLLLFFQARQFGPFHYHAESLVRYTVATVADHLRKRLFAIDNSLPAAERLRRFFVGEDHYLKLVQERYGKDQPLAARALYEQKVRLLLPLALLAMHEGDRLLARQAYLSLVRHAPSQIRTYAQLAWTFLPNPVARAFSRLLSSKHRRALMGPPKDGFVHSF
jgi:glycosyltransferase involved in cell wall biosynthesis